MKLPADPRRAIIHVDAQFFDAHIDPLQRWAADQLLELSDEPDGICLLVSHSVAAELAHPSTPPATQLKARGALVTEDRGHHDARRADAVRAILRGNAKPGKHDADAAHLIDAAHWQAGYFVTLDARILARSSQILDALTDVWVVRPTELLAIVEEYERRE